MTQLAPAATGRRGRFPAPVLALDLGGTRIRTALVRDDGTLTGRRSRATPAGTATQVSAACVAELRATLDEAAGGSGLEASPVGVGISAPGPLDSSAGRLIDPPNLEHSMWGYPLAEVVSAALDLPAALERDTFVAALAEGAFGAARGVADYVYLTVSTGVGGAIVANGEMLRGADGMAGELGHLTIDINGPACGCGERGHLEAIASGIAIARAASAAGMGDVDAAAVASAEEAGDPRAAVIMDRVRRAFAAAAVSIVDIFNPVLIVVGGGIALAQGDRLLQPARDAIAAHAFRTAAARVAVVPAGLGDDVGLVGALVLVGQRDLKHGARRPGRVALGGSTQVGDHGGTNIAAHIKTRTTAARLP
jgi:glucokinase